MWFPRPELLQDPESSEATAGWETVDVAANQFGGMSGNRTIAERLRLEIRVRFYGLSGRAVIYYRLAGAAKLRRNRSGEGEGGGGSQTRDPAVDHVAGSD